PVSLLVREVIAYVYLFSGRYGQAAAEARRILAVDPAFPRARMILGRALFFGGQREEGIRELQAHNPKSPWIGWAYATVGRKKEALEVLDSLLQAKRIDVAMVYASLGETSRALDALERELLVEKKPTEVWQLVYPEFGGLRSEPRFRALRQKFG